MLYYFNTGSTDGNLHRLPYLGCDQLLRQLRDSRILREVRVVRGYVVVRNIRAEREHVVEAHFCCCFLAGVEEGRQRKAGDGRRGKFVERGEAGGSFL